MSAKPKLLFVSPEPAWLGRLGAHQRMDSILRLLGENHEVYKLAIGKDFSKMHPPGDWMIIDHVLGDALVNPGFHGQLVEFVNNKDISVVYFNYYYFAPAARALPGRVTSVCDIHDVQHLRSQSFATANETAPSQVSRHVELGELEAFDKLISINPEETRYLESKISTPIATIPHVAPFRELAFKDIRHPIIVASMAKPNQDGFRQILLPAVKEKVIASTVLAAGGISTLASEDPTGRIIPMGPFESAADIYPYACVALAPLRFGGGLKIKVIEALVHGVPVAGTDCAFNGIPELPPEVFFAFETSNDLAGLDEFIAGVNPDRVREFAREHYDPDNYMKFMCFT